MSIDLTVLLNRSWKVLKHTFNAYDEDQCSIWAASLAYYGLFSIFPLILFLLFLGSQVITSGDVKAVLDQVLTEYLPVDVNNFNRVVTQALEVRGSIGVIGGIGLLWSASSVLSVLEAALNKIWESESRPFWSRRLIATAFILILSMAFIANLTIGPIISLVSSAIPFSGIDRLGSFLNFALLVLTSYSLYRFFPNRRVPNIPAAAGALFTSLLLVLARFLVDIFLQSAFANYGAIYGSLSWILYLAFWTFLVATLFLLGAEFGSTLENYRQRPQSILKK